MARLAFAGLVAFTLLRLSGWNAALYPLPAFLAFTPYVAGFGALLTALFLLRRHRLLAAGAALCVVGLVVVIAPRLRAADPPPAAGAVSGQQLRVTTLNSFWGKANFKELGELVQSLDSDVVVIQEVRPHTQRRLHDAGFFSRYPYRAAVGLREVADILILSAWPARRTDLGVPAAALPAVALTAPDGRSLNIVGMHPFPPVRPGKQNRWLDLLDELPASRQLDGPTVIAGDFNATLDHPQFRSVLQRGWRDVGSTHGDGLYPTWHGLPLLRLTIDHVLVSPEFAVNDYRVDRIAGSDHRAVTATITLRR